LTQSILVIAAHPDDEVLGCGAAIAKHADLGDSVNIIIVAEGVTSRQSSRNRNKAASHLSALSNSSQKAASILGAKSSTNLSYPDNRLDSVCLLDLVKEIEDQIDDLKPDVVYTHHSSDLNIDHRVVHQAVLTACRPCSPVPVKRLLSFEVQSSTEWQPPYSGFPFHPNWYVDVSDQLQRKIDALEAYESEMRPWPHSRSIEAVSHLAALRGSHISVAAAEAFFLLRNLA